MNNLEFEQDPLPYIPPPPPPPPNGLLGWVMELSEVIGVGHGAKWSKPADNSISDKEYHKILWHGGN